MPIDSLKVRLMDVPTTNTVVTRASPIMSAAAVFAVRYGLRVLFARPSRPAALNGAPITVPTARVMGTATTGLSWATPRKTMIAPSPSDRRIGRAAVGDEQAEEHEQRATAMTAPAIVARRALDACATTKPSLRPSIGGIAATRRAGTIAAARVTPSPTTTAATQVRPSSTREFEGRSKPPAARIACRRWAITSPNATPNASPVIPMMVASTMIDRVTWPGVAPIDRRSAISRDLCPRSTIEKVLLM